VERSAAAGSALDAQADGEAGGGHLGDQGVELGQGGLGGEAVRMAVVAEGPEQAGDGFQATAAGVLDGRKAPRAWSGVSRRRRAAPAWMTMMLMWWAMTSCSSLAIRARSAATGVGRSRSAATVNNARGRPKQPVGHLRRQAGPGQRTWPSMPAR
jgi:hypothetical protein